MACIYCGMTLSDYLEKKRITDAAFAATVGMSQSQVNRLKNGRSRPSWEAIAAIEKATKGKVTANDFAVAA